MAVPPPGRPGYRNPVPDEIDAVDLPVSGQVPPTLNGRYVRNGPNPLPGEDGRDYTAGHGMLHGVRLRGGRAEWYRNRWVRTRQFEGLPRVRADGTTDLAVAPANTHVLRHGGRILALAENGHPYEITPELDTVGPCDFGGRLTTAMTAHPKCDPVTGELHFFGYGARPPYLTYHRLSADGTLVHSREVGVPRGTMMHDFAITERHVVWLDLPVTYQPAAERAGAMPYQWDDDYGARLGVMRHDVPDSPVRWYEIEPCYVFHVGNAHEDAEGRIVLDAVRHEPAGFIAAWQRIVPTTAPAVRAAVPAATGGAHLHRWTLDPATGATTERRLDDLGVEFPTVNDGAVGRPSRYLYTVGRLNVGRYGNSIIKYDTVSGTRTGHEFGPDVATGEAVFVPAGGAGGNEDGGWLICVATKGDGTASRLFVLDASDPSAEPVATVELPRGVPAGFHGSWIPDPICTE